MLEKSCHDFLEVLASKEPVPGGGGAAALVGAIGMALGSMVGNLTLGKKKYADVQDQIESLLAQSTAVIAKLEDLVRRDAEAFYPLSQAYGMPRETETEKAEKERVLQAALVEATAVPFEIAQVCVEAIDILETYAKVGTRIAISDVGVGVVFCKSALQSARLNVLINTKIMKDQTEKTRIEEELAQMVTAGCAKADAIYEQVADLLK